MFVFHLLFIISILLLMYTYIGYPLFLLLFSKIYYKKVNYGNEEFSVSIIVAAYNEEKVIENKIKNILDLNYPKNKLEIVIASDGSTDNTNHIITKYDKDKKIIGLIIPENKGKTNIINEASKLANREILLYTDANVYLEQNAIKMLVRNFTDNRVGCVCGQLNYFSEDNSHTASTGGLYWRYEEFIKSYESKTGSLMGADGSIFAIRRKLFTPLKLFLIDDFSTSMLILSKGYRLIFEPEAKAYEKHTNNIYDELRRRKRIANRITTAILFLFRSLLKLNFIDKIKFLSHRIFRYMTFLFLLIILFSNLILYDFNLFYQVFFIVQIISYSIFCLLFSLRINMEKMPKVIFIPYYFIIMNLMLFVGIIASIFGQKQNTWSTNSSSR